MNFLQFKHLLKLLGIHQKDDCNHAEAGRGGVHHLKVLDMVPESTHQPTVKKKGITFTQMHHQFIASHSLTLPEQTTTIPGRYS